MLKTEYINLKSGRTYLMAAIFVAGNILLPQLCHLVPGGGHVWLPIYFFTLIAAYGYGLTAGMITAVASPLVNSMLFGMPAPAVVPAILIKSCLLAGIAALAAYKGGKTTLTLMAIVVIAYQTTGCLAEGVLTGSMHTGFADFTTGIPGMLVQIFGGWIVLKALDR